jgi:HSP20 family protein
MADPDINKNQEQSDEGRQGQQAQGDQPSGQRQGGQQSGAMRSRGRQGGGMARPAAAQSSASSLSSGGFLSMSPFELMRRFTDELDRAFSGLGPTRGAGGLEMWAPTVEVTERDNDIVVRADVPGLDTDDVKVELTDDGLIIQGERKVEREEDRGDVYLSERSYGQFYRLIPLPEDANVEQAMARINNGVLEVMIPKDEERRRRRSIPIEDAAGAGGDQQTQGAGGNSQTAAGGSSKK